MMSRKKIYLIFIFALFAFSSGNGNYGYGQQFSTTCDRSIYDRAHAQLKTELRQAPASPYQTSYGQGMTNGFQGDQYASQRLDNQCRSIRQYFKDLLINTPLCEVIGSNSFQFAGSLADQSRQFLKQHCERSQGYQVAQCYKGNDMLDCESRFAYARRSSQGNTMVNSGYASQPANYAYNQPLTVECQAFDVFRNCVFTATSRHCYASDQEYQFTYLFDHARNLAYSCPPGQGVLPSNVYIHNSLNPMNPLNPINSDYNRRSDLSYPNAISNGNYPNQQYPAPSSSFAGRQLPTYQLAGNQPASTNRLGGVLDPSLTSVGMDHCIARVQPYETQCTDLLVQRQREARYGRSSNDVQRRICCAIFYYRDCLSRIVLERCPESSRTVVDLMMGDRNRELSTNCRDYNRDQCSGVPSLQSSLFIVVVSTLLVALFR